MLEHADEEVEVGIDELGSILAQETQGFRCAKSCACLIGREVGECYQHQAGMILGISGWHHMVSDAVVLPCAARGKGSCANKAITNPFGYPSNILEGKLCNRTRCAAEGGTFIPKSS